MAASTSTTITTTTATPDGSDKSSTSGNVRSNCQVSRDEIQSAVTKAVELRALHAALMQGTSPTRLKHYPSSTSHVSHSRPLSIFSAQDYPVFTPTYDEEPLPAFQQAIGLQSRPLSGNWDNYGIDAANSADQVVSWDYKNIDTCEESGQYSGFCNLNSSNVSLGDYQKSIAGSCANRSIVATRSPNAEYIAKSSRRSSLADLNSISSFIKCKPSIISSEATDKVKFDKKSHDSEVGVQYTDSNLSYRSQPKNRGMNLSWLFPRFKKKQQNQYRSENSIPRHRVIDSESGSQIGRECGMVSVERLKKELKEMCESRDSALVEVSEMRSSLGELRQNLEYVENYCKELKRALKQAGQIKGFGIHNQLPSPPKHRNTILGSQAAKRMPINEDVIIKEFLQVVSEARLAAKDLCKNLLMQVDDGDDTLVDSLNMLLQPCKLSLTSKCSKLLLYHLEAIINQTLYQDFENCIFQKNGSPKLLDPQQQRQAQYSSYLALENLSWNEVLSKGTKYYSSEFSKFCDQKMSCIISLLNWTKPWPEQLLQSFFVAAKSVWLLHLLAFSLNPTLGILRVEENRSFDPHYMDDMLPDGVKTRCSSRVKTMVMPGFYVKDFVLKCNVICN